MAGKQKRAPQKNGLNNRSRTTKLEVCYSCRKHYTKHAFEEHKEKLHPDQAQTCNICNNVFGTVAELEEYIIQLGVHGINSAAVCSNSESDKE
ncbi:hypothetical protein LWI29_013029 [Acer saccharum]|uniref:Uncharacterized protein n=1 Tax=Acer saccharum TaxID=4024 RepID=A0AA39VVB0_ACESA|nr:hypothetical protein LWI29_013029 [Acer saccharum]